MAEEKKQMGEKLYGFSVKLATESEIPQIAEITRDAFVRYEKQARIPHEVEALNETYDDIRKDLEEKYVFVAFINGEPVGSVRIKINEDGTAYLSRFGVRSNNQNNGIGKTLMNVVDKVMQEHQVKQLRLHTAASYIPLVRFYYGRGFYIDSTEKDRGYIRALIIKDYESEAVQQYYI